MLNNIYQIINKHLDFNIKPIPRFLLTFGLAYQKLVKEGSTDVVYILGRDRVT